MKDTNLSFNYAFGGEITIFLLVFLFYYLKQKKAPGIKLGYFLNS